MFSLTSNAHQAYQGKDFHPECHRRITGTQPYRWQSGQVARFNGSDGLPRWAARLNGRGTVVGKRLRIDHPKSLTLQLLASTGESFLGAAKDGKVHRRPSLRPSPGSKSSKTFGIFSITG